MRLESRLKRILNVVFAYLKIVYAYISHEMPQSFVLLLI